MGPHIIPEELDKFLKLFDEAKLKLFFFNGVNNELLHDLFKDISLGRLENENNI